jgi:membrane-bound metal-dependent hydrolase YbcI (DUF457 family)
MPFTPYHVGPALLVALLLYPLLDIPTFLIASVIIDIEPLAVTMGFVNWPMHGVFHSLTVGTLVGIALAIPMYIVSKIIKPIQIGRTIPRERTFKNLVITSIIGIWIHVLLDSFLYNDLNLFYPIKWNPLLNYLSINIVTNFCIISVPIAFIIYLIRSYTKNNSIKDEPITETAKEDLIEGLPENEPYILYYDPEATASSEEIIESSQSEPALKTELEQSQIKQQSLVHEPEPPDELMLSKVEPEIIIGVDKTPIQWGIIGKSGLDKVAVDLNEPHIVFVCGKQGSGKGYTIGVITEMLLSITIPKISQVKKPATIIVFHKPREDLRSEFWSIIDPNLNHVEAQILEDDYGLTPRRVITDKKFRIFIDPFVHENEKIKFEEDYGTKVYPITINPSRLTAEDWPYVLSIGRKSGSMYVKKIFQIIKKTQYDSDFGLDKIRQHIELSDLNPNQKSFANMRLETLQDYLEGGDFLKNLIIGGVNVFDLRKIMMEPDDIFSVMMLVISSLLNDIRTEREQFVFVINEAHDYLRKGLSKDFTDYINYLIRKKRHAGTWLMLDTHFPEDVDPKVIKGSDIKIFHKSDVISSNLLKQIVEGTPIAPHHLETGQSIIRADKSNLGPDRVIIVQIRPRLTHHGGATKTAI